MTDALDALRDRIAALDTQLLELVAERLDVAAAIGRVKLASGAPIRDFGREKDVVHAARTRARGLGVPEDLAEEFALALIRSALTVQEQDRVVDAGAGHGGSAVVIGGAGRMGAWMSRFLASQGFGVTIVDPAGPLEGFAGADDWRSVAPDADLVVVAAPLRASTAILHALAENPPGGLIFDIGSLKTPLRTGLTALRDAGARVTSVHPMFGPETAMLSGRHVVFIDVAGSAAVEEARALFSGTMATMVDMTLDEHDRVIAYVLGLSHALNIAFMTAIAESGETAPRLALLSSTTFDAQLAVAARVVSENPHLYFEIQNLNDYGTEALSALLYAVERLRSVVRAGDEAAFIGLMQRGGEWATSGPATDDGDGSEPAE